MHHQRNKPSTYSVREFELLLIAMVINCLFQGPELDMPLEAPSLTVMPLRRHAHFHSRVPPPYLYFELKAVGHFPHELKECRLSGGLVCALHSRYYTGSITTSHSRHSRRKPSDFFNSSYSRFFITIVSRNFTRSLRLGGGSQAL